MKNPHSFYVEPWLVFNAQGVKGQLLKNPAKFANEIENLRSRAAEAIDYRWANTHYYMWSPRHRHLISFAVYNNKNGISFNAWDTDSRALGNCSSGAGAGVWVEGVKEVFARIALIDKGKAHCSDCQEIMDVDKIGGRYFAGIYCQSCWEREWKAIEAKETYN